jgi:hypothetical protein
MITVHWFVLLALALGALGCALIAWQMHRRATAHQQEARRNYALGASHQLVICNERHEAELKVYGERQFNAGWNACVAESERRATAMNGRVQTA